MGRIKCDGIFFGVWNLFFLAEGFLLSMGMYVITKKKSNKSIKFAIQFIIFIIKA